MGRLLPIALFNDPGTGNPGSGSTTGLRGEVVHTLVHDHRFAQNILGFIITPDAPLVGKDWEERQIQKYMEEDKEEMDKFK